MPLVYHVPAEIKHPFPDPLVTAFKYPDPENVPVAVAVAVVVVLVAVPVEVAVDVTGVPDLRGYLIPVDGQEPEPLLCQSFLF